MPSITRRTISASGIALLAGCASQSGAAGSPTPARGRAALGAWGVDLAARDLNVDPGDDFFAYANGTWLRNAVIPADRTRWGSFDMLREKAANDVRVIVEEVALAGGPPGSNRRKIADFYNAYLNQDSINALGLAPAQSDLAAIAALRSYEDVVRLIYRQDMAMPNVITIGVGLDDRNPDRYVVGLSHGGIGLPDRAYYLDDTPELQAIRDAYRAHIARFLTLAGQSEAEAKAQRILAFETEIARRHWPIEQRRERDQTYNLRTRAQIRELAAYPWDLMFQTAGLDSAQEAVVSELNAMGPLAQLCTSTPVATWRDYLTYRYLAGRSAVLPSTLEDEAFAFYSRTLNGQPQQRERWKRAVEAVNGALGEAVGELYVQRHFPPESKAQMLDLVENLRRGFGERIDGLPWMSAETKIAAREKLATFMPKIGYPDRWRDYSALDIRAGDAWGNAKRVTEYFNRYDAARLSRPTDKGEWLYMNPQDVNAYYNWTFNEIVFPAAILQPPFFDPNADPAVNYGGIGGVIGHEMGHGFDDQGAKSDAQGVLRDWWTQADVAAFTALGDRLVAQYDAFEALPGLNVNGRLTLGENIGDNGGLQMAYYAYQLSLQDRPAATLDGLSGDQRFFLAWAQIWRMAFRDEALRTRVMTDSHSPGQFRCNGPVRNMDSWYAAYNVTADDALFLPDNERVEIW